MTARRFGVSAALIVLATPLAAPAESEDAGAEPTPLASVAFPAEATPVPKPGEWAAADRVKLTRVGPKAAGCTSYRVREWLRIRCTDKLFALSLLGGGEVGVAFWAGADKEGEAVFPVRRGDRRVVQAWIAGKDRQGQFEPKPLFVIQEQWVEGEDAPIITVM